MVHLAGRFVGLLQVSVAGEAQQELEVALRSVEGLDVMIAVVRPAGALSLKSNTRLLYLIWSYWAVTIRVLCAMCSLRLRRLRSMSRS